MDNDDLSNDETTQVHTVVQPTRLALNEINFFKYKVKFILCEISSDDTSPVMLTSQLTKINSFFLLLGSVVFLILVGTMIALSANFPGKITCIVVNDEIKSICIFF